MERSRADKADSMSTPDEIIDIHQDGHVGMTTADQD
jgi:hypothetical protein